jgi:predicted DNA-binding protein with PD1-like motif
MRAKLLNEHPEKTYALIFETGDEFIKTLQAFARDQQLAGSHFTAIGAFREATLGYFDWQKKEYLRIPVREQVEVLSLVGDIARDDKGQPQLHAHVVVGTADGTARGGHLLEGVVLNTPQFSWTKSRMPRKAQPVPPIYQPEVAADAIVWAAHHYRREWFVGGSTAVVITANKVVPGYGDHYLAKNGYDAQMHDGHDDPNRRNNLFEPVDDVQDFGAHGMFDDRAHAHSYQLWLDQRRDMIALAGAAGAVWDAACNGPGKFWRDGLIGLALGALGAIGMAAAARQDAEYERTMPPGKRRQTGLCLAPAGPGVGDTPHPTAGGRQT